MQPKTAFTFVLSNQKPSQLPKEAVQHFLHHGSFISAPTRPLSCQHQHLYKHMQNSFSSLSSSCCDHFWCPALCLCRPCYVFEMQRTACCPGNGDALRVCVSSKMFPCLLLRSPPKDAQHLVGFFCCCCTLSWWVWTASDDSKVSFLIYECHVQVQHHLSIVDIHFLWMHSSRLKLTCQLYMHSLAFVRPFWSSLSLAQHLVTQKDLNFCFCWLCCLSFGASQEICSLLGMSLLIWNILHDVP